MRLGYMRIYLTPWDSIGGEGGVAETGGGPAALVSPLSRDSEGGWRGSEDLLNAGRTLWAMEGAEPAPRVDGCRTQWKGQARNGEMRLTWFPPAACRKYLSALWALCPPGPLRPDEALRALKGIASLGRPLGAAPRSVGYRWWPGGDPRKRTRMYHTPWGNVGGMGGAKQLLARVFPQLLRKNAALGLVFVSFGPTRLNQG